MKRCDSIPALLTMRSQGRASQFSPPRPKCNLVERRLLIARCDACPFAHPVGSDHNRFLKQRLGATLLRPEFQLDFGCLNRPP